MSLPFASGKSSLAQCDRCGVMVPYTELKAQIVAQQDTGLRVCDDCMDADHPQWMVGRWPIVDPQALQYARPDSLGGRGLFGFDPALGQQADSFVGQVQVTTT